MAQWYDDGKNVYEKRYSDRDVTKEAGSKIYNNARRLLFALDTGWQVPRPQHAVYQQRREDAEEAAEDFVDCR